jgi:hypothetical protein
VLVLRRGPTDDVAGVAPAVRRAFKTADITLCPPPRVVADARARHQERRLVNNFVVTREFLASPMARTPFAIGWSC